MEMVSGSRPASDEGSMRLSMARSYGTFASGVERPRRMFVHMLVWLGWALAAQPAQAQTTPARETRPIRMVVLGDSLSAGLGLPEAAAFPAKLKKQLKFNGIEVDI